MVRVGTQPHVTSIGPRSALRARQGGTIAPASAPLSLSSPRSVSPSPHSPLAPTNLTLIFPCSLKSMLTTIEHSPLAITFLIRNPIPL